MDGREEGTLIDALLLEFVRAPILFVDLRLQARHIKVMIPSIIKV